MEAVEHGGEAWPAALGAESVLIGQPTLLRNFIRSGHAALLISTS
jgi:hypothetical protein